MTDAVVLPDREAVDALRRALAAERTLVEPRPTAAGPAWEATDGSGAFAWAVTGPAAGVKDRLFPAREPLLVWDAAREPRAVLPAPAPFALFGLRPCDLAAIAHTDAFFARDPWYAARRAAAFLVGVDCLAACDGGFCVEVDAGPFARAPFDLDLTPLADGRVVAAWGSAAGRAALAAAGLAAAPADQAAALGTAAPAAVPVDESVALAVAAARAAAAATFPVRPYVARVRARIDAAPAGTAIADAEWQALGPACLACTGCTSVCPTCTCFTVVDEAAGEGGTRARLRDSCLLEGFQREASGHHPAPRPGDRVRRFWSHKLARVHAVAPGRLGCVGCGRCDVVCPGGIGALRVLRALGSEAAGGAPGGAS